MQERFSWNAGCKALPLVRFQNDKPESDSDFVAVEEPLEIRIDGKPVSVTMRTPGHDRDLAMGFLFAEGIVSAGRLPESKVRKNMVDVLLKGGKASGARRLRSHIFVSSSCGLCGRSSVAQIRRKLGAVKSSETISPQMLAALMRSMRRSQEAFGATGGSHAAALFDVQGNLSYLREDVGRHNAVDKAIGGWIQKESGSPLGLLVSGRASFEIVQKALAARIVFVAAVSAPSSLAVELAREAGMTLIGFLRGAGFNVYSRGDRIVRPP